MKGVEYMKEYILKTFTNTVANIFKVKSIVTFATVAITIYMVVQDRLEPATVTAIVMMVFQSLFNKDKKGNDDNNGV